MIRAEASALMADSGSTGPRRPLAQLLHALNQPLTGLQCSLELACSGPRSAEQYLRTLQEALELAGRMRVLVEAIREVTEETTEPSAQSDTVPLEIVLRETAVDLHPVADTRAVNLALRLDKASLPVRGERAQLAQLAFRWVESALSLARGGSELSLSSTREGEDAILELTWCEAKLPTSSPFSAGELGLLVACAGWQKAGGAWSCTQVEERRVCMLRMPLALRSRAGEQKPSTSRAESRRS